MENSIEYIQSLIDGDQLEDAEVKARELLLEEQNNLEAKTTLARVLLIAGKDAEASDLLKSIIEQDGEDYFPLYLLAIIKDNQKEFDEAIKYYNRALKLKPNNGQILYQIGKIYNSFGYKGKNEYSALHNLRNAISSENPPVGAFLELASVEPLSRSIYILQKGIEKYPSDEDLHITLCEKLYRLDEYSKCIESIDNAKNLGITSVYLQVLKALVFYETAKFSDALNALQFSDELEDNQKIPITAFRGLLLCESQKYKDAEKVLREAIADDVRNSLDFAGHIILICCHLRNSEIEKAERVFKEIPITSSFTSSLFLSIGEYFEVDSYLLEALDGLVKRESNSTQKAKYFRAIYTYSAGGTAEEKLSSDKLEQIKKDLLASLDLPGKKDPVAYEYMYFVSMDLKEWIDAANYYFLRQTLDDEYPLGINQEVLEAINRSQKNVEKLFSNLDQFSKKYYTDKFAERCLSNLISFFHSKERFDLVTRLAEMFKYGNILKAESVFEIAYAYAEINNKKLARSYYKAYLRDVGENSAVANNLALLEEDAGNLAEAERLAQLAIKLDPADEKAKNNHSRIISRIRDEEEKKQAYQKAANLYQQETTDFKSLASKLYSLRTEDELILFSYSNLSEEVKLSNDEIDYRITEFLNKKYFDEIESKSMQFDGRILRANPAITPLLENDLRKFKERDKLSAISNELLSDNLDLKYGYNQSLLEKLSSIKSPELAKMLERDLYETIVAVAIKSYKPSLILCGSIAESILLDAMLARKENALKALERILTKDGKSLKADDKKLDRWVLDRLLDVALEMNLISENLYHWGHGLRGFRNLVHPGVEQRQSIEVSRENAEMAWNVVKRLLGEIKTKEESE